MKSSPPFVLPHRQTPKNAERGYPRSSNKQSKPVEQFPCRLPAANAHASPRSLHASLGEAPLCRFWLPSGAGAYEQAITGVTKHVATAGCMISC